MDAHEDRFSDVFRIACRAFGAAIAIGIMELLAGWGHEELGRVPFVTSIVLVLALPDSEPARPSSVIGGHLVSTLCGLLTLALLGPGESASAIAVGFATGAMITLRVLHPPAGIDAFLVAAHGLTWGWLLSPVLVGSVLLAVYAWCWRSMERRLIAVLARIDRR